MASQPFTTRLDAAVLGSLDPVIVVQDQPPSRLHDHAFAISVDQEIMIVSAGQHTREWPVARGAYRTVAHQHPAGARVAHLTKPPEFAVRLELPVRALNLAKLARRLNAQIHRRGDRIYVRWTPHEQMIFDVLGDTIHLHLVQPTSRIPGLAAQLPTYFREHGIRILQAGLHDGRDWLQHGFVEYDHRLVRHLP